MLIGSLPVNKIEIPTFLFKSLFQPYIMSGLLCAFIAAISWIGAASKFKLSYAYPFVSLTYVFVMILSMVVLKEKVYILQWLGILFILLGVFLISRVAEL